MNPSPMTNPDPGKLREAMERLEALAKPDKGLRYRNGRVSGTFEAELEIYGANAEAVFWIIENAAALRAALLQSAEARDEAERERGRLRQELATAAGALNLCALALDCTRFTDAAASARAIAADANAALSSPVEQENGK